MRFGLLLQQEEDQDIHIYMAKFAGTSDNLAVYKG